MVLRVTAPQVRPVSMARRGHWAICSRGPGVFASLSGKRVWGHSRLPSTRKVHVPGRSFLELGRSPERVGRVEEEFAEVSEFGKTHDEVRRDLSGQREDSGVG
eukprot:7684680-Lingulodinium_polyedra.AAC.1